MRWKRALMLRVRLLILSVKERNGVGSSLSSTTPLTMVPIKHILLSDDIIHQARVPAFRSLIHSRKYTLGLDPYARVCFFSVEYR